MKTLFGWLQKKRSPGTPYVYAPGDHPTLGAEGLTFQHPNRDPIMQVQGCGTLVPFHYRYHEPQKWSIQTVILAGIPATTGTFDLNALTDINFRPYGM